MRRSRAELSRAWGALWVLALPACGLVLGIEDLRAPSGDAGTDAGNLAEASAVDGGCVDFDTSCPSDDDNCAFCGHRCGAGSHCVDRTCTPVGLASRFVPSQGDACALAAEGARLFIALAEPRDGGAVTAVRELLADGGLDPVPAAIVDALAQPSRMALDDDHFYLFGQTNPAMPARSIVSCPRAGGAPCTMLATSSSTRFLMGFARSARGLFATDTIGRALLAIPAAAEADAAPTVLVKEDGYIPFEAVADEDAVYWREMRDSNVDASTARLRVMRLDLRGASAADAGEVLAEVDTANGLAEEGAALLFGVDGGVARLPKLGGALDVIPIRESSGVWFATATSDRWFAFAQTNGAWILYERPRCGGHALAIAQISAGTPAQAAVFGDSVYVCTSGATFVPAALLRVAK